MLNEKRFFVCALFFVFFMVMASIAFASTKPPELNGKHMVLSEGVFDPGTTILEYTLHSFLPAPGVKHFADHKTEYVDRFRSVSQTLKNVPAGFVNVRALFRSGVSRL